MIDRFINAPEDVQVVVSFCLWCAFISYCICTFFGKTAHIAWLCIIVLGVVLAFAYHIKIGGVIDLYFLVKCFVVVFPAMTYFIPKLKRKLSSS